MEFEWPDAVGGAKRLSFGLNREIRRHPENYVIKEVEVSHERLRAPKEVAEINAPYKERKISKNGTAYYRWREQGLKELEHLTDKKSYMNKIKSRADEVGVDWMLKLAEIAWQKEKPSHWYATATSKENWERTKKMLCKLCKRIKRIVERIGGWMQPEYINWLLGAQRIVGEATFWEIARRAEGKEDPWAYLSHALNEEMLS